MTVDFVPIKVTACDESKVRKLSGSKTRYILPFALSAKPTREWEDIFDDVWQSHRKRSKSPKVQTYVRKGDMVLECALGDVKEVFPSIREVLEMANQKYLTHLNQKAEKDEKKRRKREEEKLAEVLAIKEALDGLDFS